MIRQVENKPISNFNCSYCGLPLEECKCRERLGSIVIEEKKRARKVSKTKKSYKRA